VALVVAWAAIAGQPRGAAAQPPPGPSPAPSPAAAETYPIDLPAALRLAERANPTIAIAREAVLENLALQQQARTMLLPTLVAGGNLRIHEGNLQRSTGQILDVNSQSLYFGGGAGAVGAGSVGIPAVYILSPLSDALLEPLVARQRVALARFDARAASNTVLLEVALGYLDLLGAQARLEAYRQAEAEINSVVQSVNAFVKVGQARKSDADRAQTRGLFIRNLAYQAEEGVGVASARLARTLDLDPAVHLRTVSGPLQAVDLVDPGYDLAALAAIALRCRPELAARSAAVALSEARWREEKTRPFLPTISAGYSAGEFGGGSDLAPARFDQFAGRTDFDVWAVWTLQNAGLGNLALQRSRRAEVEQAVAQRVRAVDVVREEVGAAYALSAARRRQMDIAARQLPTAEAGFREELVRTRGGVGLPIEALNSFELLVRAHQDWIVATIEYDQAQFRLFVSLGEPPTVALSNAQALSAVNGRQ
jgi:outer membrane protein TolC